MGHLLVPEMESLISQSNGGKSDPVVAVGLPKGSRAQLHLPGLLSGAVLLLGCARSRGGTDRWLCSLVPGELLKLGRSSGLSALLGVMTCCPLSPLAQRAIRVRSHSMETMVGSQKKHHGSGIPGSLSGGIAHNSGEVTKTTFSVSMSTCPCVPLSLPVATLRSPRGSQTLTVLCSQPPVPAVAAKNQSRSPIKRRSGLFPRLHTTSESQAESRTRW